MGMHPAHLDADLELAAQVQQACICIMIDAHLGMQQCAELDNWDGHGHCFMISAATA